VSLAEELTEAGTDLALHLKPSDDCAEWVAFHATCPACGSGLRPLGAGNTTGITSWLPVKCTRVGCRREWGIRTQIVGVEDQSQAQYLGGVT
jgi:hypothetical protein